MSMFSTLRHKGAKMTMTDNDLFEPLDAAKGRDHAAEYLKTLAASPYQYHIDDDPHDIITFADGKQFFTDSQCAVLMKNMETIRTIMTWTEAWEIYYTAVKAAEKAA